jgi:hypothetical protein
MALIEISDLDAIHNSSTSDWVELPATEAALICGGWRNRYRDRLNNLFQVAIADFMNSDLTNLASTDINSASYVNVSTDHANNFSNFFYTDSGIAPVGGVPIPGHPGAYTF